MYRHAGCAPRMTMRSRSGRLAPAPLPRRREVSTFGLMAALLPMRHLARAAAANDGGWGRCTTHQQWQASGTNRASAPQPSAPLACSSARRGTRSRPAGGWTGGYSRCSAAGARPPRPRHRLQAAAAGPARGAAQRSPPPTAAGRPGFAAWGSACRWAASGGSCPGLPLRSPASRGPAATAQPNKPIVSIQPSTVEPSHAVGWV